MTEALAPVLGGLGMLGVLAAFVLGSFVLLVLPLWAILHCLVSDRSGGVKASIIVALVLTWGLGAIFYGLFASRSRLFQVFTVASILVPLVILVPSLVGLGAGTVVHARAQHERDVAARQALVDGFRPAALADRAVDPFVALHFPSIGAGSSAATLARFTVDGPGADSARAVDSRVRQVAVDAGHDRVFALTAHEFGTISPSSGRFSKVEVDPTFGEFSWPTGLAFDVDHGRVVVMTSHVVTRFFTFDPDTSDWRRLPAEFRDLPLIGLAYSPDDRSLYAVERRSSDPAVRRIHRFNPEGASLGAIELDPPVPFPGRDRLQLEFTSSHLVLMLPTDAPASPDGSATAGDHRLLFVDPADGRVYVPAS